MRPYQLSKIEWERSGISQLRMRFTDFARLPGPGELHGYGLRPYRAGDEEVWLSILSASDFGDWDRARLERMIAGERAPLPKESIWFATRDDHPVAAANAFLFEDGDGVYSELGWVCVAPPHRGHGLAFEVCRAVMNFAKDAGHRYMYLKTEDFRLPAIKTYLRLGFVPEELDPSQNERWSELRRVLGIP